MGKSKNPLISNGKDSTDPIGLCDGELSEDVTSSYYWDAMVGAAMPTSASQPMKVSVRRGIDRLTLAEEVCHSFAL